MLEKDFDQLIRDQFEDHSSPVPVDMWQRIKGKDDKDRKGLFFWKWYFLGPAFLALSLVGGLLFFHHATPIHPAATTVLPKIATGAGSNSPAPAKTTPSVGSNSSASTKTATPAAPLTASAAPATPASNPSAPAKTAPPVGSNSPANATPASANPAASATTTPASAPNSPAAPLTASVTPARPTPTLASTEAAPHQPSDRPSPPPIPPTTAGTHRPQSLSCPDPSKKFTSSKGWYLEALGSPDHPIVHSSFDGASIKELPLLSYTIGIRVTKVFESGFLMTAGLQYSWINLRQTYDLDSLPLPHHFRNLDLPLLIGYEKGNDLFKVGIQGGMIFNIHSWPGGNDQYFSNYLKSNTGISSYIGIELIRQVNDRISIFVQPYYRHQFSDMFKNPFVEKIDVAGIFLGLRFTLKSSGQ